MGSACLCNGCFPDRPGCSQAARRARSHGSQQELEANILRLYNSNAILNLSHFQKLHRTKGYLHICDLSFTDILNEKIFFKSLKYPLSPPQFRPSLSLTWFGPSPSFSTLDPGPPAAVTSFNPQLAGWLFPGHNLSEAHLTERSTGARGWSEAL